MKPLEDKAPGGMGVVIGKDGLSLRQLVESALGPNEKLAPHATVGIMGRIFDVDTEKEVLDSGAVT